MIAAEPLSAIRRTRIVLSLLIGNSDLHLENFSFLGEQGRAGLSPVYDPAPTRGFNSLQWVSVVAFGGLVTSQKTMSPSIGAATVKLGTAFGLQTRVTLKVVEQCLEVTSDYAEFVQHSGAAEHVVSCLLGRLEGTRLRIERAVRDAKPSVQVAAPAV